MSTTTDVGGFPAAQNFVNKVGGATSRWLQHANPLPAFIEACCVKEPDAECRVGDFYVAYTDWARQMGYSLTQTQQTVSLNLEHLGFAPMTASRGTVFAGLKLLDRDQHQ